MKLKAELFQKFADQIENEIEYRKNIFDNKSDKWVESKLKNYILNVGK